MGIMTMSSMPVVAFYSNDTPGYQQLYLQDDLPHEQDEESAREIGLLQIELETMKAIEQIQMLQQVGDIALLLHAWIRWPAAMILCYEVVGPGILVVQAIKLPYYSVNQA